MKTSTLHHWTGTLALIRLILRRDRFILPLWIILGTILAPGTASSFAALYPDEISRMMFVKSFASNPTVTAMLGEVQSFSLGGLVVWRWSVAGIFVVSLANILTIIRHSRNEEETGRAELVGSAVVGRFAPLSAVLIVTLCADILFGVIASVEVMQFQQPAAGSLVLGLAVAGAGFFFAGIAAVADRLAASARGARAAGGIFIGAMFVVSMVGNLYPESILSWCTPYGWVRHTHPFAGDDIGTLLLFIPAVLPLIVAAFFLTARRDINSGLSGLSGFTFFSSSRGAEHHPFIPKTMSWAVQSPLALAWRLHRTPLIAWLVGYMIIGGVFGVVADVSSAQLMKSPLLAQAFSRAGGTTAKPGDLLFTMSFMFLGEALCLFVISTALLLRAEEESGRADMLLATSVGRTRWALSHIFWILVGSTCIFAGFGASAGLSSGWNSGDSTQEILRLTGAALAYLPALWVFGGFTVALFGLIPRFAVGASWSALALSFFLDMTGEFKQISSFLLNISPFTHVPKVLMGEDFALSTAGLVGTAILLTAIGLVGLHKRDVG